MLISREENSSSEAVAQPRRHVRRWHAVSIVNRGDSCARHLEILGRRFLSADAPRLPLAGCALGDACRCVYRHHSDRRASPRRIAERIRTFGVPPVEERRYGHGRRATDA